MSEFAKKIEIYLKKLPKYILRKNLNPILIKEPQRIFTSSNVKKILILRHDRIGDVLVTIPFIRNLKLNYPKIELDIILSHKNYTTKQVLSKYISKFYCYDKNMLRTIKLFKEIQKERYDLVIDPFDNASVTSDLFLTFSKAKEYLGIDKENRNNYTYVVTLLDKHNVHIVERISELLIPFGINPNSTDLSLEYEISNEEISIAKKRIGEKIKSVRLGVNLSGSNLSKYWGKKNYIDFILTICKLYDNVEIVIFYEKHLENDAKEISTISNVRLAPQVQSFNEFSAMVLTCDIILTPDTSVVHLASAWKKPCIALYSHIPGKIAMPWYPYKTKYVALTTEENNISNIRLDRVLEAFENLFRNEFNNSA